MQKFARRLIILAIIFASLSLLAGPCSFLFESLEILHASWRVQMARAIDVRIKFLGRGFLTSRGFVSQYGQDQWLKEKVFFGKNGGFFVDIGAHDGVEFSNTFLFEKDQGWQGLAIEPVPESFAALQKNRSCQCLQGCVSAISGTVIFSQLTIPSENADGVMLSGLKQHYDAQHTARIQRELLRYGGQLQEISVPSFRFMELIDRYGITHIDYLSVDTEGSEAEILQSIDFSRIPISVIGVENNYGELSVPRWLSKNGYRRVKRIGRDDFYFAKDFKPLLRSSAPHL
ncbi:MAG: FkbM family methyltransferase [Pseudomonadota bacterium]